MPIHSAIEALVAQLVEKTKDGWLAPSSAANRFDERSASLSKRFGRLKTKMGFGPAHVFHSIRKTVATMFEDAACPDLRYHLNAD